MDLYPATYSDAQAAEMTVTANDGELLRMRLRGLEFVGSDFDSFEPPPDAPAETLGLFTLHLGCLCSCRIECKIPVLIDERGRAVSGDLLVELVLGDPAPNGGLDREELRIVLEYDGKIFVGSGTSGWFEDELLGIQSQLPAGVFIKACINCLYSDYSPAGHGLFGCMMCFRNLKNEYLNVTTKREFWSVSGRHDRWVQETYLCPEFERRTPGTGYRG